MQSNWREVLARIGNLPTRKYEVSGDEEDLNRLDQMFAFMDYCCKVGHSTEFTVSVDGDGSARLSFKIDGKDIKDALSEESDAQVNEDSKVDEGHNKVNYSFGE